MAPFKKDIPIGVPCLSWPDIWGMLPLCRFSLARKRSTRSSKRRLVGTVGTTFPWLWPNGKGFQMAKAGW